MTQKYLTGRQGKERSKKVSHLGKKSNLFTTKKAYLPLPIATFVDILPHYKDMKTWREISLTISTDDSKTSFVATLTLRGFHS